jgi:hypothetical protein
MYKNPTNATNWADYIVELPLCLLTSLIIGVSYVLVRELNKKEFIICLDSTKHTRVKRKSEQFNNKR